MPESEAGGAKRILSLDVQEVGEMITEGGEYTRSADGAWIRRKWRINPDGWEWCMLRDRDWGELDL